MNAQEFYLSLLGAALTLALVMLARYLRCPFAFAEEAPRLAYGGTAVILLIAIIRFVA